jgi:hypothetical protein
VRIRYRVFARGLFTAVVLAGVAWIAFHLR